MAYSKNPYIPKVRAQACRMVVSEGRGVRAVARYIGVSPGTISKWLKRYPHGGAHAIPTLSSKPKSHPQALDEDVVKAIIAKRKKRNRCAEVVHRELLDDGITVSLSSVKRVLDRHGLTKKRSPYKKQRNNVKRPFVASPGDLVQMDTIHMMQDPKKRMYIYTLIDLHSRWAYAQATEKIGAFKTVDFVHDAQKNFPYTFTCLQSDNGPEFSPMFSKRIMVTHRHSRVRRPNDNAHIERFNRTIQEELLHALPKDVSVINRELPSYLKYYNEERLHMGIDLQKPIDLL